MRNFSCQLVKRVTLHVLALAGKPGLLDVYRTMCGINIAQGLRLSTHTD